MKFSFPSSGDPTRTDDLWVMSPTSCQLLHPAMYRNYFSNVFKKPGIETPGFVVAGTRLERMTFGL